MATAPILATARLTLAGHAPADLAAFAAMWSDPAVYAPIGARAFTREEVWHRLLRYIGHWTTVGYGNWAIRETATGRLVGEAGLMDSRRATDPSFEGTPEMGWALCGWAQGHGFAKEALDAILAWSDPRFARTMCIIDPANTPSLRLAKKVGYRLLAEGAYKDAPTLVFERRSETSSSFRT